MEGGKGRGHGRVSMNNGWHGVAARVGTTGTTGTTNYKKEDDDNNHTRQRTTVVTFVGLSTAVPRSTKNGDQSPVVQDFVPFLHAFVGPQDQRNGIGDAELIRHVRSKLHAGTTVGGAAATQTSCSGGSSSSRNSSGTKGQQNRGNGRRSRHNKTRQCVHFPQNTPPPPPPKKSYLGTWPSVWGHSKSNLRKSYPPTTSLPTVVPVVVARLRCVSMSLHPFETNPRGKQILFLE